MNAVDSPFTQMQQRLEGHFDALARTRNGLDIPVFALEHGLGNRELEQLRPMLKSLVSQHSLPSQYWLLWVIYATEIGYDYAGDEYWGSFEDQTPGWEYHYRERIKRWFRKFQNTYGGIIPSGPWAEHFTIIAWPITHAILPLYLQRQFAKLLYNLRFQLASRITLDARAIGQLLASHASHDAPKRFRVFLEQEELTGQIVLALLGGEPAETKLIHPPTLKRIVTDLEQTRNAREWLKETQHVVSDRFKGIGRGAGPATLRPPEGLPELDSADTSRLTIRPRLFLRHVGKGKWSVFLQIKSFRPVAALSPDIHSFLDRTRCRLNGAHDFKPTGWLLSGNRKGALQSWPDPALPLICFEQPHLAMDHLLESECRLHSGRIWLFRVGTDGIARHIAGGTVRPGRDYIVVTTTFTPNNIEGVTPCNLDCENANAYRLLMPSIVSTEMTNQLSNLGLHVARTIRVWPAGLPGRGWDGEGSSEWLTTESPCLGIAQDHPVESLTFRLNDGPETLIRSDGTEDPLFVRLRPLPAGKHTLTVTAQRNPELDNVVDTPVPKGFMQLAVRDPEPWTSGVTSHPGLIIRTDPDHADLDIFWKNKVSLYVNGPEGFAATFLVTLQAADGKKILSEIVGNPMNLPITPSMWRSRFDRFLEDETHAEKYLEAAACTLTIRADTLGTCELRFEHDPVPVRWIVRSNQRGLTVKLVDDSGQEETEPEIKLYGMENPFQAAQLTLEAVRKGCVVKPPGGLFVAVHEQHHDAVLVSAPAQGLKELVVESTFLGLQKSSHMLSHYFHILERWHDARLYGFLAQIRHRQLVKDAANALRAVLCGPNWTQAENKFSEQRSLAFLDSMAALVDKHTKFGDIVLEQSGAHGSADQRSAWFADAAAKNNVCQDRDLSEFAFLLASDPLEVINHSRLESLLAKLIDNPAVLRAARLLTLRANYASGDVLDAVPSSRHPT